MVERYLINYDERGETLHPSGDFVHYQDYASLERQIAELRAERDEARELYAKEAHAKMVLTEAAEAENARLRALPLKDEVERVLEPFADIAGEAWADENGWTVAACPNDRIRDWFGPSAFRAVRALLSRLRAGEQEGWQQCATEGCDKPATVHFERGGIGSYYCHGCYMRIQALPAAPKKGEAK